MTGRLLVLVLVLGPGCVFSSDLPAERPEPAPAEAAKDAEAAFMGALKLAAEDHPVDFEASRRRVDMLSFAIGREASYLPTTREKVDAISRVVFGVQNWAADPDDLEGRRPEAHDVSKVLETRRGACLPMAIIIARAASGAGIRAGVARAPGHVVAVIGPENDRLYLDPAERGYHRTWASIVQTRPFSPKAAHLYDGRPLDAPEVIAQLRANRAAHRIASNYLDKAESDARAALIVVPDLPEGLVNLAAIHLVRKEPDPAYELLERARSLLPKNAVVLFNLGLAAAARGDADEAIAHYQGALEADPSMEKARANKRALELQLAKKKAKGR